MNTDEVKMVSGTKWKLVFLATLARLTSWISEPSADEKVSRRIVLTLEKHSILRTPGVLQFPGCCFRSSGGVGILIPHSCKISNKAEVLRHQRGFLLL